MRSMTQIVSDQTFQAAVLESPKAVLVDYWAEWCAPCKMIGPLLEAAAVEYADRLTVVKLDMDENPLTPSRYAVRGIPTLMIFKDGQPAAVRVGSLSRSELRRFIETHIPPAQGLSPTGSDG